MNNKTNFHHSSLTTQYISHHPSLTTHNSTGISLIALIVTIIVIIILSSIVYFSTNDALNSMSEANFKTELRGLQDRLKIYHERANMNSLSYKNSKLNWDGISERATNTGKVEDGVNEDTPEYIFGGIPEYFKQKVSIKHGDLFIKNTSNNEMKWAREIEVASNYNYTELEYIESTRTQYIDLHYIPKTNTVTELELSFSGEFQYELSGKYTPAFYGVSESTSSYSINFGGTASYLNNSLFPWFNKIYNNGTNGQDIESFSITDSIRTQKNLLKVEPGKISYGTVSRNITTKSADQTQSIFLFGQNNLNSTVQKRAFAAYDMKVYSLKFYEGSTLCRNYIPCYCNTEVRNVDGILCPAGTIGLYDTVNGDFYTNGGTGTFNAGPEI